jgi:uncharacterized protein YqgV (UPF0045/DUF77 family)
VTDMVVSAQISVYPLRQPHLRPAVDAVLTELQARGLHPEAGSMSTLVTGEADAVFTALRDSFERVAETGHVVLVVTLSNACPT